MSARRNRWQRRISTVGEWLGVGLIVFGLTSDASGVPYAIAGIVVALVSLVIWLRCSRRSR